MNEIEILIKSFLDKSLDGPVDISEDIIEEFGESCKQALRKQFNEPAKDKFTLRMSNVGKPLCQLQMEKSGAKAERKPYSFKMQMLIGDMHEAALIAVMRAAGVKIKAVQKKVSLDGINGTLDLIIETDKDRIYDAKSASPWSFKNKFGMGFDAVADGDTFGYVGQGFGYGKAEGTPFGGWIVSEKSTGEIAVCEAPQDGEAATILENKAVKQIRSNVKALETNAPFKRCFEDEAETFRKKATGNRVLGTSCGFCEYKWTCWPGLQELPDICSSAQYPKMKYYTKVADKYNATDEEAEMRKLLEGN